jgi:predicted ferric reductase
MFFIFTAASDTVRRAHYEIFFSAHHWFVVYFACLLMHGPIYWKWAFVPLSLYFIERVMQERRGDRPYYVNKVEWIDPVMAIQFRPVYKQDFVFKEGQYLYLNCPYINKNEWHPFTISSASSDLATGPRIALETGEEVREVSDDE